MQMVQADPRYMDIFKELTGIDIGGMQEDAAKRKPKQLLELKQLRRLPFLPKRNSLYRRRKTPPQRRMKETRHTKPRTLKRLERYTKLPSIWTPRSSFSTPTWLPSTWQRRTSTSQSLNATKLLS